MHTTPTLSLPLIAAAQAQKHVTHNEALSLLDTLVQLSVNSRNQSAPPGSPADGERYIVGPSASDEWAGWDGSVAVWAAGAWLRMPPGPGWRAWIVDEGVIAVWSDGFWQVQEALGNPLVFGVNAMADAQNRLTVKSDGVLFSHDDVTPGTGDFRMTANKDSAQRTASLLFQSGWSGRAELGLTGSDAFSIKVSADGIAWTEALVVDPATGIVSLPATPSPIKVLTAEDTSGTLMPDATYVDQNFVTTTRNDFGGSAWDGSVFTVPEDGAYDFGASLAVNGAPSATAVYFLKNGASQIGFCEISGNVGQNTIASRAVISLTAGDTVSVRMRHNHGSAQLGLAAALYSIIRL